MASLAAFGLHIPDLSTQSRLVTGESVPNLIGLAVGAGGENDTVRYLMSGALALSVLLCCRLAWRRRDSITASGWASVALLVTLSWVLPWYVLWVAAPGRAIGLAPAAGGGARARRLPDHRMDAGVGGHLARDRVPSRKHAARAPAPALCARADQLSHSPSEPGGRRSSLRWAARRLLSRRRALRGAGGTGGAAGAGNGQGALEALGEASESQLAVACLRALVLRHRHQPRARRARARARAGSRSARARRPRRRRPPRGRR